MDRWQLVQNFLQLAMVLFLAFLTWRQQQDKNALTAAKSAEGSAVSELSVHKEASIRLSAENRELIKKIATLEARTDLHPLIERMALFETENRAHFLKVMERLETIHTEQTRAMTVATENLTELAKDIKQRATV